MAYRKFETPKARYILGLMNHGFEENLEDGIKNGGRSKVHGLDIALFDDIDGLVVEETGDGIAKLLQIYWDSATKSLEGKHEEGEMIYVAGDPRHQIIVRNLMKVPIYSTDVDFGDTREDNNRRVERRVKSRMLHAFYETIRERIEPELFSKEELNSGSQWFAQLGFYLECEPIVEGRNAINAEKIERWVVPRVSRYSGKEKPTIGLVYGAHHLGIEQDLKSQRRRRKILRKMQNFKGWNPKRFNLAQEAVYNPETRVVNIKEQDTGLF